MQELEPGALHERGFHPTAIWGTLSAAAACARLNRLNADETTNAIAIAASLAAGTVANFGTMTKSLHAGRTAQSGVLAARLAKSGFTASSDVLEHKAGFMHSHSHSGNPAVTRGDWGLGENWRLAKMGINIKRYPMCYATHRSIDAMLDLAEEHNLDPGRDRGNPRAHRRRAGPDAAQPRAEDRAGSEVLDRVRDRLRADRPQGRAEGAGRRVRAARRHRRDDAQGEALDHDERMADMPPFAPDDRVSIRLKNGQEIKHEPVVRPKGHWQKPLTEAELREKFLDCTETRLGRKQAEELFEKLNNLEDVQVLRELPLVKITSLILRSRVRREG